MTGTTKKAKDKPAATRQPIPVAVRRVAVSPEVPPKAAQHFSWARVGTTYQLDVGHIDMQELRGAFEQAKSAGETPETADLFITDRFVFGLETAERLVAMLEDLAKDLAKEKKRLGIGE